MYRYIFMLNISFQMTHHVSLQIFYSIAIMTIKACFLKVFFYNVSQETPIHVSCEVAVKVCSETSDNGHSQ